MPLVNGGAHTQNFEFGLMPMHDGLYFTVEKFTEALEAMPKAWKKLHYLDIQFMEHQRCLVATHPQRKPIYLVNGVWIEWEIAE